MNAEHILTAALTRPITGEEACFLLHASEKENVQDALFAAAREVRRLEQGDRFYFSGGISGVLPCNLKPLCLYCPYWRSEKKQPPSVEDIVAGARWFHENGIREFHLSGGTTLGSEGMDVLEMVQAIWDSGLRDMKIVINCGAAMSFDTLKKLKEMGVIRVGAVFETLAPHRFSALKPGDDLDKKKEFARLIAKAGLELSSGLMAGLGPAEQRYEEYAYSLEALRDFPNLTYIYISKFRPDPSIPLREVPQCSVEEGARLIAVARLVLRGITIRPSAGWSDAEREMALNAGAGGDLFAMAVHRSGNYWDGKKAGELQFLDTRAQKQMLAQRCGISIEV